MKTKQFIALLIAGVLFSEACSNRIKADIKKVSDIPQTQLSPDVVAEAISDNPLQILSYNNHLFIRDNQRLDGQLIVYNLDNSTSSFFIRKGRGPGELIGFYDFCINPTWNQLVLLDIAARKIMPLDIQALTLGQTSNLETRKISYSSNSSLLAICEGGERLYGTSLNGDMRIESVGIDGSCHAIGDYSPDGRKKRKNKLVSQAYMGRIAYNNLVHSVIIACRYSDQIEIFDVETNTLLFIKGPECFEPKYSIVTAKGGSKVLSHSKDEQFGYIAVKTYKDKIYALYSGRSHNDSNPSYADELRIFDIYGNYLKRYALGEDLISFDLSWDKRAIFALNVKGDVLKYEL